MSSFGASDWNVHFYFLFTFKDKKERKAILHESDPNVIWSSVFCQKEFFWTHIWHRQVILTTMPLWRLTQKTKTKKKTHLDRQSDHCNDDELTLMDIKVSVLKIQAVLNNTQHTNICFWFGILISSLQWYLIQCWERRNCSQCCVASKFNAFAVGKLESVNKCLTS